VVLYGRGVAELRFLCHSDELLDVVPLALEESCVVRYGIIRVVWRGYATDDSELLVFLGACLQIRERRLWIEQLDTLDVLRTDRVSSVGIEDVRYHSGLVGRSKADVARLFADDADNATGILIEDDHADAEPEVLEVLAYTEEV